MSTSVARNPDALTRPGNFRLRRTPVAASLSMVLSEHDKRRAASMRRIIRTSLFAWVSPSGFSDFCRIRASRDARSAGDTLGSDRRTDFKTSNVDGNIGSLVIRAAVDYGKSTQLAATVAELPPLCCCARCTRSAISCAVSRAAGLSLSCSTMSETAVNTPASFWWFINHRTN